MRERGWAYITVGWMLSWVFELLVYNQVLPPEMILVSLLCWLLIGGAGAMQLAESKGYVGRYGALFILAGVPFLIWYFLAPDRWKIEFPPLSEEPEGVIAS